MRTSFADALRKALAVGLCAALLIGTPGVQAFAAEVIVPRVAPAALPGAPLGSVAAGVLRAPSLSHSSIPTFSGPSLASPQAVAGPTIRSAGSPAVQPAAAARAQLPKSVSRVKAPLAARAEAAGLVGVIGHDAAGGNPENAPEAAAFIAAPAAASKGWAAAAFSFLRGESRAASQGAVDGAETFRRPLLSNAPAKTNGMRFRAVPAAANGVSDPTSSAAGGAAKAEAPRSHLSEDFLGFRSVHGVRREALGALPASATVPQVIDRIARQFGMPRETVVALGRRFALYENSERAGWLAVYDRLQAGNRAEYEHLDHKKYQGWSSFLAVHKHVIGLTVRLPYHLFDSFLFGFFRRAATYEFRRGGEDFFAVRQALDIEKARAAGTLTREMLARPPLAEKWLESALQAQFLGGLTARHRFLAKPWARSLRRWVVVPFAAPLYKFVLRRATLAILSALAMGFVTGAVPMPILAFHLTGVPVLGPALAWLAHGLPAAAAGLPLVGGGLSAMLGHAFGVLVDELTVGGLLNAFTLSTMLTYPRAVRARLMEDRGQGRLHTPRLRERAFWYGLVGTLLSARFWKDNLKSLFGLLTVGAEIEGIMSYAGGLDAAVTPAFKGATGHEFKLFSTVAAAVERPEGQSPIPFGGAITWGNVLIYKLQNAMGLNITDTAYHYTHGLFYGNYDDAVSQAVIAPPHAGGGAPGGASVVASILGARAAVAALEDRIDGRESRLAELEKQSNPISETDQRAYEDTLRLLAEKTDRAAVESKLAEITDLKNPKDGSAALGKLEDLADYYRGLLPAERQATGYLESVGVRLALVKTARQALADFQEGRGDGSPARRRSPVDAEAGRRIEPLVAELEKLRGEARAELTNRDSLERLLASAARARELALNERRGGKEMLEFHKNMARLATVMDLAFSLNTIEAAQRAILDMQRQLDAKLEKIRLTAEQSERDRAEAELQKARLEEWRREVAADVADSQNSLTDMTELEEHTRTAVEGISSFRSELRTLLARIDAEDRGSSAGALAEYGRRKALLPTLVSWNTDGKPGDPDFTSLKSLRERLADVDAYAGKVSDGLGRIGGAPVEFAGVLVVAVPGVPDVSVSNPSAAQTLQILAARRAQWEAELASYKSTRDKFRDRLDPDYAGSEADDFGDSHPVSLPRRLSAARSDAAARVSEARELGARVDAAAAEIRAVLPGVDLPSLSGLGLEAFRTAIEGYPDKLKAVEIPGQETAQNQKARVALLKVGRLIPAAGHVAVEWSEADATVAGIQDALSSPLPQAAALYDGVVGVVSAVLADVAADEAYVRAGFPQGQNQGLIDRKRALLQSISPVLAEARTMLSAHAIPFQQGTVRSYDPSGDKYAKLFDGQIRLFEGTRDALEKTLPWALAANGAKEGDTAGGLQNIEARRQRFRELSTGYDDERGHHKGVEEHLANIAKLKDPDNTETEEVYGQTLPKSLPRLITQFTAEKATRAGELNERNTDINGILERIDAMTGGRHDLAARRLPTGLGVDPGSVDRVQALVDGRALQTLGDLLAEIGAEYKAKSGDVSLEGGGDGLVPSGTQPTPKVDDNTQLALLALEAAKRLVPSSAGDLQSAPAAYAVARFLYSDAVVAAAKENLYDRIPVAEAFLTQAKAALADATRDLDYDVAYVRAGGTGESGDSVIDRKVRVYSALNAVTRAGMSFYGMKVGWDQASFDTVARMGTYYDSTRDIYANSGTVTQNEVDAIRKMKETLQKTFDDLQEQRTKLNRWMGQLNDPEESALKRIGEDLRRVQEKTRAVLEQNFQFRDVEERFKRSEEVLDWTLKSIEDRQARLSAELKELRDPASLDPQLRHRIEQLRFTGSSWYMGADTGDATAALVVPKKDFGRFIDAVFSSLLTRASSGRDLSAVKRQLLENPSSLSDIMPGSKVIGFGEADGFYMVYQTEFSVPHGLESSNWVTLGNVAKLWGNNVSVTGYQFASPPNDENAPWGDKGVDVQIESIQGKNWVNYLNVDFHRFIQDIPPDTKMASTARQSRLMVFEDFAVLLFGDKLYVAFTGFADGAVSQTKDKPYFYGGSLKSSLKFSEVMRLNAEQQQVFAKDPRYFLQTIDLDFTGLDPEMPRAVIRSDGEDKYYKRTQVGPSFDIGRLMDSQDAFTVDLYWARQEGTDDYNQDALGVSVLKGFTLRAADGKPWMVLSNRAGAEMGERQNAYSDKVTVALPDYGVAVSAEGRLIGDARTYYLQAGKKLGETSEVALGYGTRYPGMPERLTLQLNTSFTLGQLWRSVAQGAAEELQGGGALTDFDAALDAYKVKELREVFQRDVASRLARGDIGRLAKELQELRRAGALMDNTRVRGMVGFTSNPIGESISDRAVGGGFTAGTQTTLTLNKTQKALVEQKVHAVYREGMRLQYRMMELTKQWQASLIEAAEAQWELKMARVMAEGGPGELNRREGAARAAAAELRLRQASARYNAMAGRPESDALPFKDLSAAELEAVLAEIRSIMAGADPLVEILKGLDPEAIKESLGGEPFNLVDWLPWVDQLTVSVGVQFQDLLANQLLGVGGSVRLPIYDPASKERDKAYRLEAEAAMSEMLEVWADYGTRAERERLAAAGWEDGAALMRSRAAASTDALDAAVKGHRNGLVPESRLREAYDQWRYYQGGALSASAQAALLQGWAGLDQAFARPRPDQRAPGRIASFQDAFDAAASASRGLDEIEARRQAAAHMTEANASRIQKVYADLFVGWNITATGVGWLPSFGATGVGVTPILTFELKTAELRDLQVRQGEGQQAYFQAAQAKLEADLAVEFYRQGLAWHQAGRMAELLEREVLPEMRAAGKPQMELDLAARRLRLAQQEREQARAALNHLLGRAPDAPLDLGLDPERALADLKSILAAKRPVEADQAVLAARVSVARAVEVMADKNLKIDELRLEPVSLVVRSLGRLVRALSEDGIGNPDVAAAARVQTLEAERAALAYAQELPIRRGQLQAELSAARTALRDAPGKVAALDLEGRIMVLEGALARVAADAAPPRQGAVPGSFAELTDRAAAAQQELASAGRSPEVDAFEPEVQTQRSLMGLRYYSAKQTMGGDPIDKNYLESWVEFRLRAQGTPEEVLLALAKLRVDKASRMRANDAAAARAKGQVLVSEFEATVRFKRWLDAQTVVPRTAVDGRLAEQGARLKALLALPEALPVAELAALVPAGPDGRTADVTALSARLLSEVRALDMGRLRETVFDGGVPESFGNEDSLINQIRADVIAERMSYKGFTPVAAFGLFRGKAVGGLFMEAPDPRSISAGLQRVLSDSVRRELESQGRMRELSLRLHLLMIGVEGRAKLAERQAAAAAAAQEAYRAAASRVDAGLAGPEELLSAQDALVRSWLALSATLAELKSGFITLVSELDALGYDSKKLLAAPAMPGLPPAGEAGLSPAAQLADFASRRSLDAGFAGELEAALAGLPGAGAEAAKAYAGAAASYRALSKDAEDVRHHPGLSPEQRLRALTAADVEGRRLAVAGVLARVLDGTREAPQAREAILAVLSRDLTAQESAASGLDSRERALAGDLRKVMLDGLEMPAVVRGQVERLETLRAALLGARQALREESLKTRLSPTEFLMSDQALDRYLRALTEYDAAVLALYAAPEVKGSADLAYTLDGLHPLKVSLARATDLARQGRGMLALSALVALAEDRLAALRWERGLPSETDAALAALRRLTDLRASWRAKDPKGLSPLVALTKPDAQGRRGWNAADWLSEERFQELYKGRITVDADGRRWVAGPAGERYEAVSGLDVAEARFSAARGASDANEARRRLYAILKDSEFALIGLDGAAARGISYADLTEKARAGQLFVFAAAPDRRGLRPAAHPLKTLWDGPGSVETIVYVGAQRLARDRFPTYESLREHVDALRAAGSPAAEDFLRLEAGPAGLARMLEAAKELRTRSQRAGWIGVKLQSYGVAVDEAGRPRELYLVQDDFDAARAAHEAAPRTWAEALQRLAEAKAAEVKARAARDEKKSAAVDLALRDAERRSGQAVSALVAASRLMAHAGQWEGSRERTLAGLRDAGLTDEEAARRDEALGAEGTRRLLVSRDLVLHVDSQNNLVRVSGTQVFGVGPLDAAVGVADGAVRRVPGELFAAELDVDGRLVKLYMDPDEVAKAGKGWVLVGIDGREASVAAKAVDPAMRVLHYADPATMLKDADGAPRPGTALPVLLNRRYMIELLTDSGRAKSEADSWAYGPWNWGNILWEIPKGVLGTPVELLTGRDANQNGYLGRVNMYKTEGGATEHQGVFRKALGLLDVLDLMPDHVDWYFDPSMFPKTVTLDSELLPGENVGRKDMRAGDKDVHLGRGAYERTIQTQVEDLVNARRRVLSHFSGGVQESWLEDRRGRAGSFTSSRVLTETGTEAVDRALDDPAIGYDDRSTRPGEGPVTLSGRPGHVEVDRVERRVEVTPGGDNYGRVADRLAGLPELVSGRARAAEERAAALAAERADAEGVAETYRTSLGAARAEEAEARTRAQAQAWRIGAQRALEGQINRLRAELSEHRSELAAARRRLAELEDAIRRLPRAPANPSDPSEPQPSPRFPWLPWVAGVLALAAALAVITALLLRRRRVAIT
ncbi:MAG: hypothetical protein HYZ75_00425 [Elusimicrobia bacterium]|nr:hypothetical protein [Elusimicrobiota bacterium]